jgi:hypothetical protein
VVGSEGDPMSRALMSEHEDALRAAWTMWFSIVLLNMGGHGDEPYLVCMWSEGLPC